MYHQSPDNLSSNIEEITNYYQLPDGSLTSDIKGVNNYDRK